VWGIDVMEMKMMQVAKGGYDLTRGAKRRRINEDGESPSLSNEVDVHFYNSLGYSLESRYVGNSAQAHGNPRFDCAHPVARLHHL
jgi:hypothetical protein